MENCDICNKLSALVVMSLTYQIYLAILYGGHLYSDYTIPGKPFSILKIGFRGEDILSFLYRYIQHSGKSAIIRESNHDSGVCKRHYGQYYVPKSAILLAGTGVWKIISLARGFSSIKINYSDYPKRLISRINEVNVCFQEMKMHNFI